MGGNMTKILPRLYLGGLENTKDQEELLANCISHLLTVHNSKYDVAHKLCEMDGRQCLQLFLNDRDKYSLIKHVPISNNFIHQARTEDGNVLVCSESGMSANVAIVAAYLMTLYDLNYRLAMSAIQGLRYAAYPVIPLQEQLEKFGQINCDSNLYSSPPDSSIGLITPKNEKCKLIEQYGEWTHMEEDLSILKHALNTYETMNDCVSLFNNNHDNDNQQINNNDNDFVNEEQDRLNLNEQNYLDNYYGHNLNHSYNLQSDLNSDNANNIIPMQNTVKTYSSITSSTTMIPEINSIKKSGDKLSDSFSIDSRNNLTNQELSTYKNSPTKPTVESDVFTIDPLFVENELSQVPTEKHSARSSSPSSHTSSSIEIGMELKDDNEDIPGAIDICIPASDYDPTSRTCISYHNRLGRTLQYKPTAYSLFSNRSAQPLQFKHPFLLENSSKTLPITDEISPSQVPSIPISNHGP